jgi:hypothetical protein
MLSVVLLCAWQAHAVPIDLEWVNVFRDTRSVNDVGLGDGDRINFTTNIRGGPPAGTTISATYPPTGFMVPPATQPKIPCSPSTAAPTQCGFSISFNPNRLGSWKVRLENLPDFKEVDTLTLAGAEDPVPFAKSVTISGRGLTPTIAWEIPGNFVPDGIRVNIRDKNRRLPNGGADNIHSDNIDPGVNSYQIPAMLSTGLPLEMGGDYTIEVQLIETRGHVSLNSNLDILRRSNSFFAFSPLSDSDPPNEKIFLPTAADGIFHFSVGNVGPDFVTFIDPPVAVGYDYATGPGDPNFKSMILPEAGDNIFDLYLWNGSEFNYHVSVASGFNYIFPPGVDRFRVLGIEASAGLDPNNVTAFITGLTFVSSGQFTGTMTPIVASDVIRTEIKPGDGPNCVNPKSKGVVPFAILGGEFDVTTINQTTLQVDDDIDAGTGGVAPAQLSIIDINGDGINDLVIHFNTQDLNKAGLLTDGRTVYITARLDGKLLVGSDVIFMSNGPTCQ